MPLPLIARAAIADTDGYSITCRCGHIAGGSQFTQRPVSGLLPSGHYQCPACAYAWTVKPVGPPTVHATGWIEPADQAIHQLAPVL